MTADPAAATESPSPARLYPRKLRIRAAWTGSASGSSRAIQRLAGLRGPAAPGAGSGQHPACRDDRHGHGGRGALCDRGLRVRVHGRVDGRRRGCADHASVLRGDGEAAFLSSASQPPGDRGCRRAPARWCRCKPLRARSPPTAAPASRTSRWRVTLRRAALCGVPGGRGRCAHRRAVGAGQLLGARAPAPPGLIPAPRNSWPTANGRTGSLMCWRRRTACAPWWPRPSGCCRRLAWRARADPGTLPAPPHAPPAGAARPGVRRSGPGCLGAGRGGEERPAGPARPGGWPATSRRPFRSAAIAAGGVDTGLRCGFGPPRRGHGRLHRADRAAPPRPPGSGPRTRLLALATRFWPARPDPDRHAGRGGRARR